MDILQKANILKKSDGEKVNGYVYIRSYQKQPQKNGGFYMAGNLSAKGDMQFKSWSNTPAFETLSDSDLTGKICSVTAKVNEYGGSISLLVENISPVEEGTNLKPSYFFEDKYDAELYYKNLIQTLRKYVSDEAMEVFKEVMCSDGLMERFVEEFAAVSHHDNCRSGLLAHTTKVVKAATIVRMYPEIMKRVEADLLFVGCALHDVGKIFEYNNGSISEEGKYLPHLVSGVVLVAKHRARIVELKGEKFYNSLLSVISQHHGDYGEPPRTVAAYVISKLDLLDSCLTSLNASLENKDSGEQVLMESNKLI